MLVHAVILVKAHSGAVNNVAQGLINIDGVSEVFSVAGRYDLVAILRTKSNERVAEIVTEAVQNVGGIDDTETLLAFKAYDQNDLEAAFSIGNDENKQ